MLMVLGISIISAFWFVRSIPLAAAAAGNEPLARMTSMHRPPHGDVQVANFVTEEVLKVLQSGGGPDRGAPYEVPHSPGPQVRPHDGVEEIADRKSPERYEDRQHRRGISGRGGEQTPHAPGLSDVVGEVARGPKLRVAVDKRGRVPPPGEIPGDHGRDLVSPASGQTE